MRHFNRFLMFSNAARMDNSSHPVPAVEPALVDPQVADILTLSMLPGVGPRILTALLERFGDSKGVLSASAPQLASVPGVGPKLVHAIGTASHFVDVDSVVRWCTEHDSKIVCRGSAGYPNSLEDLPDAPPVLFVRGEILADDEIAVAIVGTRHATTYGLKQAEHLAYALAKAGVTVVSGLARGIDAAAHEGALDGGGRTIAVLGSGLGQIYPSEHQGLAKAIAADGAVISEYAPDAKPRGGMFPQRNRLIAGLSLATLVVEAPDRSGALITARLASEQNRDVLAVPGPVTSRASRGCNQLIRDGAILVQTVDDILEQLGPVRQPVVTQAGHEIRNGSELTLNEVERKVLESIDATGTLIDDVIQKSGLPAHHVIAVISVLEMRRLIRRLSGQYVSRI
jgi:DNA processing protein